MSYDSVGSSGRSGGSNNTNNGGGTPSTATSSASGGRNQGGGHRLNNNFDNFDHHRIQVIKEFVSDRWKELREKLADHAMMMASSSSSNNNNNTSSSSTATTTITLPEWTDETCRQQQQTIQHEIKSLLLFCLWTEFMWWFQLNYHQYCQHLLQEQQQQEQQQGQHQLPSHRHLHNNTAASTTTSRSTTESSSSDDILTMLLFINIPSPSLSDWMILPNLSKSTLFNKEEWLMYSRRVFLRLKSAAYNYMIVQTIVVPLWDIIFSALLVFSSSSRSVQRKLSQQPYHRSLYVASFLSRTSTATTSGGSSGNNRKTTSSSTTTSSGSSSSSRRWSTTLSTTKHNLSWSDKFAVATDSIVTCLFANISFFMAVYTYGQYVEYRIYQQQQITARRRRSLLTQSSSGPATDDAIINATNTTTENTSGRTRRTVIQSQSQSQSEMIGTTDLGRRERDQRSSRRQQEAATIQKTFQQKSIKLLVETFGRYVGSAIGAGIGTFVIGPGYGTLFGIGIGDGITQIQISSKATLLPSDLICSWLLDNNYIINNVVSTIQRNEYTANMISNFHLIRAKITKGCSDGLRKIQSYWTTVIRGGIENSDSTIVLEEDLMCGCCQIVAFSSDPTEPNRSPVSSRECSHTICKKCVQQVHLNLVERVHIYTEWISCPVCKAPNAFSSHNHLINRSLCSAIGLIERKQLTINQLKSEKQKQQFYQRQQEQRELLESSFGSPSLRHLTPIKKVRSSSPTSISVNSRNSRRFGGKR